MSNTLLRQLCGDLEDQSVFSDHVNVTMVRVRLEAATEEAEAKIARLEADLRGAMAEIDHYRGWTRWQPGIWSITHPPGGPSAKWLGEGLDEAIAAASAAGGEV